MKAKIRRLASVIHFVVNCFLGEKQLKRQHISYNEIADSAWDKPNFGG